MEWKQRSNVFEGQNPSCGIVRIEEELDMADDAQTDSAVSIWCVKRPG